MATPTYVAGEVWTAAYANSIGMHLVKTQTIGTGVGSQNVTSCFSSDYDNYLVTIANMAATNDGAAISVKLLSGTTATTNGFYGNVYYVVAGAAGALTNATYSNAASFDVGGITTASNNNVSFEVLGPNIAKYTRIKCLDCDDNYLRMGGAVHAANTAYDGIQILNNAGGASTLTGGTIRVYGYRNSLT